MTPVLIAGLGLLACTLVFALVGMLLIRSQRLHRRTAGLYTLLSTVLVLVGTYLANQSEWMGLHLRALDFWSLMVIVAILCYSLVWAAVAYGINQIQRVDTGESFLMSMLSNDTLSPHSGDFARTEVIDRTKR